MKKDKKEALELKNRLKNNPDYFTLKNMDFLLAYIDIMVNYEKRMSAIRALEYLAFGAVIAAFILGITK